jgi:hypothetical protein
MVSILSQGLHKEFTQEMALKSPQPIGKRRLGIL